MDRIWNRACNRKDESLRTGDVALSDLLVAHGFIMNGGVYYAMEYLSKEEVEAAIEGYRYFGIADAANLLAEAARWDDDLEIEEFEASTNERYHSIVPDDSFLMSRLEASHAKDPEQFAPI